jgi:hypothetical protein
VVGCATAAPATTALSPTCYHYSCTALLLLLLLLLLLTNSTHLASLRYVYVYNNHRLWTVDVKSNVYTTYVALLLGKDFGYYWCVPCCSGRACCRGTT